MLRLDRSLRHTNHTLASSDQNDLLSIPNPVLCLCGFVIASMPLRHSPPKNQVALAACQIFVYWKYRKYTKPGSYFIVGYHDFSSDFDRNTRANRKKGWYQYEKAGLQLRDVLERLEWHCTSKAAG